MSCSVKISNFPMGAWEKKIPQRCLLDRDEEIVSMCRGRSVLHLGAADAPFEEEKAAQGELLHQKVKKVARELIGVDVNHGAVQRLTRFGIVDIICADINDPAILTGRTFDVVLCCDVIEHVLDPGTFLCGCARFLHATSDFVVTTVNATAVKPALRAFLNREAVHQDHICYFSYGTLCQLLIRCGLKPAAFGVFMYPTVMAISGWVTHALATRYAGLADGILVIARKG
jgi:2-polyprenyl-3-methyl-5-hydroxy-6-metoxy-1,4-benzoquinol methylase